jgi:fructokinase
MILVIGETLLDIFQDKRDPSEFKAYPGGAPANVAVMLKALAHPVRFFTVIGEDPRGTTLLEALKSMGLPPESIIQDATVNTPFALVEPGPVFKFYHFHEPLNQYANHFRDEMLDDVQCLVGSGVIVTHKKAYQFQKKVFKKAIQKKIPIALDLNIRPFLTDDMVRLRKRLLKLIAIADIIKLSKEDYAYFTHDPSVSVWNVFDLKKTAQVLLTDGANGAQLIMLEKTYQTTGIPVDAVDTTGAGDAFMGAYLNGYLKNPKHHEHNLADANKKAALSTTFKGAMSSLIQLKDQ